MNTTLPTLVLLASTLVACSDNASERDPGQPHNDPVRSSVHPDFGKLDRSPPLSPAQEPASAFAVLSATTMGGLCLLDPVSGAAIDFVPSTAIDLFASPQTPSQATVTGWSEEGGGVLFEYDVSSNGLTHKSEEPLHFDDTRLLYGPAPILALGKSEGTTLFVGGEGRTVFGASSFLVQRNEGDLDVFLLEHTTMDPRLLHLRWDAGLREVARTPTTTPRLSCAPRLVRDASEPLLAGLHEGALFVRAPDGTLRTQLEDAARPEACIEDALWLEGTGDVAVVTGPDIRIHVVSMDGTHDGETLVMAGSLAHDPRPHRRLAYDPARARLWMALSERFEMRRHTFDGHLEPDGEWQAGCDAESVTLVW